MVGKQTILYLGNHFPTAALVNAALSDAGYNVLVEDSLGKILQTAGSDGVGMILMDEQKSGLDCYGLADSLRKHRFQGPIVLLTEDKLERREFCNLIAGEISGYIQKPLDKAESKTIR